MTKRIACLLLAMLAAVNLYIPAFADGASAGSGETGSASVAAQTKESLPAPVLKSVKLTAGGVKVTWGAVKGAAKYRVFYKTGSGSWTRAGDTAKTSYTVTGLKSGKTYTFTVRCLSASGKSYASAYDKTGRTVTYVAAPTVQLALASGGIKVTWNRVAGAARYRVYYRVAGGSWHSAGTTASTSYTWKGAKSGKTYEFTVRCTDADKTNISSYRVSNSLRFLAPPALKSASLKAGGVKVTWDAVKGAAKYRVFYKTGSGSWTRAGDTTNTSYTVTGLKSGKTYTFTVRCLSSSGKSYASAYDKTGRTAVYIAAPTVELVNINNGMKATWNKVAGAKEYKVYFRAKGSGGWNLLGTTKTTSYVWNDAVLGMSYAFTVRAVGKNATSSYRSGSYVEYTGAASSASPTDI